MKNVILELTRIQKEVLELSSPADQVHKIVDSICEVVGTDVCTLYIANNNGDMHLIASHGLSEKVPISIPVGKGLVGLVAENKYPINLEKASEHPRFYYVAETEEERYQSFCGVPLVRYGKMIGVLVVQRIEASALSPEDEAFLVTLSSQLALLVDAIPDAYSIEEPSNQRIVGVKASSGTGIGKILLLDHGDLFSVSDAPVKDTETEIQQWHDLLEEVRKDIHLEQSTFKGQLSDSISSIFTSYFALLNDHSLLKRVEDEIKAGNWLPGALRNCIQYFSELFKAMDDPYLKARHEDLYYLGNKLYLAYKGKPHVVKALELPDEGVILVSQEIFASDLAAVPLEKIKGIVSFQGSSMSHTAILSSALGIPAVMGVGTLKNLSNEEVLIVDGNIGQVIRYPNDLLVEEFQRLINEEEQLQTQLQNLRNEPAVTTDNIDIKLLTNSGLLADLSPGLKNGAQGVGLYRTEIPFMVRDSFPSESEQIIVYKQVFEAYPDKPVYMRTLDIGGDKQLPYFPITREENPALGWRGIRFTLDNLQLMHTQVRAMIRASEGHVLNLLLPMISSTQELNEVILLVDKVCEELKGEGFKATRPRIGVMIEVPAAISQIPHWSKKIDFISIGSNDLSQYLLALDRNNARVASRYDHLHPAVIHEIGRVLKKANRHNLAVSLCGEMAADPLAVLLLLGMGLRTLSMNASRLLYIKSIIRSVSIQRCEELVELALDMDDPEEIRTLLKNELEKIKAE